MTVGEAKNIARQWVEEQRSQIDNFYGAYFSGSFNFKGDEEIWEDWADIDIRIVVDGDVPDGFIHKRFVRDGVLFDPWYDSLDEQLTPEAMLASVRRSYHFAVDNIVADPTGGLAELQTAVARDYAKAEWVRKRCEKVREKAHDRLVRLTGEKQEPIGPGDGFWAWSSGVRYATDIPVLAALAIPTGRRYLITSREVLGKYGYLQIHERILDLWGCAKITSNRIDSILGNMTKAFDRAVEVMPRRCSTIFEDYLKKICRPYAIAGSRQMIDSGSHREAAPFILAGFRIAIEAIDKYGPAEEKERYIESYRKAMETLGFTSEKLIVERAKKLKELLPEIMEVAEHIIENNPDIIK